MDLIHYHFFIYLFFRWWVTCHANQTALAHVTRNVLQSSVEEVQKIRSILRFALGGLSEYRKSERDWENTLIIDRYVLHLLYDFHLKVCCCLAISEQNILRNYNIAFFGFLVLLLKIIL